MVVIQDIQHMPGKKRRKPFSFKVSRRIALLTIGILLTATFTSLLLWRQQTISQRNSDSMTDIRRAVSRLLVLPNEDPVLATVTDKSKINVEFLKQAENGDKILIFAEAKRVVIYRPSINKIVDIGPVSIDTTKNQNGTSN
jgi:hypothetical protein